MLDAPTINLHGAAVVIDNIGVLIRGNSGSGKTELAMELISRGHKFVADDLANLNDLNFDLQTLTIGGYVYTDSPYLKSISIGFEYNDTSSGETIEKITQYSGGVF